MGINIQRTLLRIHITPTSPWRFPFYVIFFSAFYHFSVLDLLIMSTSTKPEGSHKWKKSKSKDPSRADQAIVNWKADEFQQLCQTFQVNWGLQFPTPGGTTLDAPPGYITFYSSFSRKVSSVGMPRITHFEFICRAQHLILSVDMFNVFYYVPCTGGFYSFNSRTANVLPCSRDPPKSLHDWKHKFFYIRRGVIPIDMHYRLANEGIPKLPVIPCADKQWYKTLTRTPTAMLQLDEMGLVIGGEMVTRLLPDGELPWLEEIKDYFHHPTEESLSIHVATPTSAHPFASVKSEVVRSPASGRLLFSRARSLQRLLMVLFVGSGAATAINPATVDSQVAATEPVQERPEAQARPGVQTGVRPTTEKVEEDQATLTQIMEKKMNILADAKRKIDTKATLNVSKKEDGSARSAKVTGSRSRCSTTRSSKPTVPDISSILGPESPPVAVYGESPARDPVCPEDVKGNGLEGVANFFFFCVEKAQPSTLHGVVFHERVEGVETDGGSDYGRRETSGSWIAHDPSCDNLPHAPRRSLVQGSRMDSLDNSHEFYSMSLPPAEHLYQKK
ncbi:hypothetical protein Hanom_Chr15g01370081 [Helianthus anomalus]